MSELEPDFLDVRSLAIFGAKDKADNEGFQILEKLKNNGYRVYPVNPRYAEIAGMRSYANLDELPMAPDVVVLALPPEMAMEVVKVAESQGIRKFWVQPAAKSEELLAFLTSHGLFSMSSENILDALEK